MLEVELWDYHSHTHFSLIPGFKNNFYFQLSFVGNMFGNLFLETLSFWKNQLLEKQVFIKRNFIKMF